MQQCLQRRRVQIWRSLESKRTADVPKKSSWMAGRFLVWWIGRTNKCILCTTNLSLVIWTFIFRCFVFIFGDSSRMILMKFYRLEFWQRFHLPFAFFCYFHVAHFEAASSDFLRIASSNACGWTQRLSSHTSRQNREVRRCERIHYRLLGPQ